MCKTLNRKTATSNTTQAKNNRDGDGLFLATEVSPLFNTDVPVMTMEEFFRTLDHESE